MKPVTRKFTALEVTHNSDSVVSLRHGNVEQHYSYRLSPSTEFDTEEEALAHAFEHNPYGRWMIVPIVRFQMY